MKTKNCCCVEIAKMVVLVALIGIVAWYLAAPFALGFVATATGSMVAGQVVEVAVICVAIFLALKVIARGVRRIRGSSDRNNGGQ